MLSNFILIKLYNIQATGIKYFNDFISNIPYYLLFNLLKFYLYINTTLSLNLFVISKNSKNYPVITFIIIICI